jgi:hypothetical protein
MRMVWAGHWWSQCRRNGLTSVAGGLGVPVPCSIRLLRFPPARALTVVVVVVVVVIVMPLIYSLVSRSIHVLAEYTASGLTGNFSTVSRVLLKVSRSARQASDETISVRFDRRDDDRRTLESDEGTQHDGYRWSSVAPLSMPIRSDSASDLTSISFACLCVENS